MPRYHNINGVRVQFTAEEETARDNEETAWANGALNRALTRLREQRDAKLAETDYLALSDNTLADNMKTYRQELRDLTDGLDTVTKVNNVTWPTKPS
tara:strand:+ start:1139 stop:1429 length:291 start_codon:yes stop_codon:yes gene_type:complete